MWNVSFLLNLLYPHSILSYKNAFICLKTNIHMHNIEWGTGVQKDDWGTIEKSLQKTRSIFCWFWFITYVMINWSSKKRLIFCNDRWSLLPLQNIRCGVPWVISSSKNAFFMKRYSIKAMFWFFQMTYCENASCALAVRKILVGFF